MSKRLCQFTRQDIAEGLGSIHQLVVEPKFVCQSCARSSSEKGSLCKPTAIPPAACQALPPSEKPNCGLLVDSGQSTPIQAPQNVEYIYPLQHKESTLELLSDSDDLNDVTADNAVKSALKEAEKTLKAQEKYNKKLEKVLKKQKKLLKKQQELMQEFARINNQLIEPDQTSVERKHVH